MTAISVLRLPLAPLDASPARSLPFLPTHHRSTGSRAACRGPSLPFSLRATTEGRSAGGTGEAAVVSSGILDRRTLGQIREELYQAVDGIDRGIFGAPSEKKSEIQALILLLESRNPTPDPTDHLDKVAGCWRLIYSTITILGSKRTKLGLRDLITLGDFLQTIDVAQGKAINEIKFNVRGLQMLSGQLTIVASFAVASKARVNIKLETSGISPDQLMNLFQKNYEILLAIFNPEGWLEISYVDEFLRIGRDDKGNIFILERFNESGA